MVNHIAPDALKGVLLLQVCTHEARAWHTGSPPDRPTGGVQTGQPPEEHRRLPVARQITAGMNMRLTAGQEGCKKTSRAT